jgi:hypothetical protein
VYFNITILGLNAWIVKQEISFKLPYWQQNNSLIIPSSISVKSSCRSYMWAKISLDSEAFAMKFSSPKK